MTVLVVQQLGIGLVVGVVLGGIATLTFARLPHAVHAFAPVASVAAASLSFGAADVLGGSGFLAVYIVGLAVGSTPSRYRGQLVAFHEGVAFLAQVAMFVVLGLLVFPHDLPSVALPGLALAALLVFAIRPIAVWVSTVWNDFTHRERALLGWAGLRGAVPIVLGTFALSSHIDAGETIFNAVFFVVVLSTLAQGTTLEFVAKGLGLLTAPPPAPVESLADGGLGSLELVPFDVQPTDAIAGVAVRELGLPRTALVAALARGRETIPPRGSTTIATGDRLYVLAPRSMREDVEDVFARWRRRV
jgi:cell volume regulation protein A